MGFQQGEFINPSRDIGRGRIFKQLVSSRKLLKIEGYSRPIRPSANEQTLQTCQKTVPSKPSLTTARKLVSPTQESGLRNTSDLHRAGCSIPEECGTSDRPDVAGRLNATMRLKERPRAQTNPPLRRARVAGCGVSAEAFRVEPLVRAGSDTFRSCGNAACLHFGSS